MTKLLNNLLGKLSYFHKEDEKNIEIDPRDGTEEGDEILGKVADEILENFNPISKEEMYKKIGWT